MDKCGKTILWFESFHTGRWDSPFYNESSGDDQCPVVGLFRECPPVVDIIYEYLRLDRHGLEARRWFYDSRHISALLRTLPECIDATDAAVSRILRKRRERRAARGIIAVAVAEEDESRQPTALQVKHGDLSRRTCVEIAADLLFRILFDSTCVIANRKTVAGLAIVCLSLASTLCSDADIRIGTWLDACAHMSAFHGITRESIFKLEVRVLIHLRFTLDTTPSSALAMILGGNPVLVSEPSQQRVLFDTRRPDWDRAEADTDANNNRVAADPEWIELLYHHHTLQSDSRCVDFLWPRSAGAGVYDLIVDFHAMPRTEKLINTLKTVLQPSEFERVCFTLK